MTEVFSPARVNKLAAKFGLVPRASLDLTNGWEISCAEDQLRAWKLIKKTVPYVIIGSPHVPCFVNSRSLINTHVVTIPSGLRRSARRSVRLHNMLSSAWHSTGISSETDCTFSTNTLGVRALGSLIMSVSCSPTVVSVQLRLTCADSAWVLISVRETAPGAL